MSCGFQNVLATVDLFHLWHKQNITQFGCTNSKALFSIKTAYLHIEEGFFFLPLIKLKYIISMKSES